jgi:hypothetical protein
VTIAALPTGVRLFVAGDLSGIGVTMFNLATNKSDAPPVASAGDSERANQPRPEVPYKPYAELELPEAPYEPYKKKPGSEAAYKPYPEKPATSEAPYEPYKGI